MAYGWWVGGWWLCSGLVGWHQPQTHITNHPNHPYNIKCGLPCCKTSVCWWVFGGLVAGCCSLSFGQPTKPEHNPQAPKTKHDTQTDSHQPLCIKCGLPSCRALVCWWVCGGCVVGGWLVVACFNLTHQTRTRPPSTQHHPQTTTTYHNHQPPQPTI